MQKQHRLRLLRLFTRRFSKGELRALCYGVDIPYENFPDSLSGLALEMLVYCEKRDMVPALIEAAREMRSDIDWTPYLAPLPTAPGPRDGLASGVWKCPDGVRGARFVGSRTSRKYHAPECGWARRIAPENRLCFDSQESARDFGYQPCAICEPPS